MGDKAVAAAEKVAAASKLAAEQTAIVLATGTGGKVSAISATEISNVVAEKNAISQIAISHKVKDAIVNDAITQRLATEKETAKSAASFNRAWNSAIIEDQRRTEKIIANRLKQANATVLQQQREEKETIRQSQIAERESQRRIQLIEREAARRDATFNKMHERALKENELRINTQPALESLNKVSTSLAQLGQRFRTFGYLSSIVVTAPMLLAGKAAFSMAKDYEFSIQKIVGLAGVAQESVNKWSEAILKMAPEVAQTPQALADALYFIASSGIKGAQALDVLQLSAKAATSGMGSTKDVADYLTSALNAYRGSGLTAAYATDVLVAAVREGKAEAQGFAMAMGSVIPSAVNLGVSLDQVAGGLAAITLTGSKASEAATYLKGLFTVLLKKDEFSTGPGAAALKELGTSYGELRKILHSGPEGVINLMQKFRDMQAQYGDDLVGKVIPNIRGMNAIFSVAGKNFQYNTELMKRVTNASGSLATALAAVSDTIKVKLDTAVAKAQVSLITFGKTIAPTIITVLNYLVKKLDDLTKWWNSLTEAQQKHKLTVLAVVAALGPLSLLASALIYSLSGLIKVIELLGEAWIVMSRRIIIGDLFSKIGAGFKGILFGAESVTGAFAGTALAAETMAAKIAAGAGSLLGFGVALAIVLPIYKKLWDKIQEMKGKTAEMKAALDYISPIMELSSKIDKLMFKNIGTADKPKWASNMKNLDDQGLSDLRTAVMQRLALEQDDLANLKEYSRKKIEGEKEYLVFAAQAAEIEINIEHYKNAKDLSWDTKSRWINKYVQDLGKLREEERAYIADRTYEIQVMKHIDEGNIENDKSILHTMDLMKSYKEGVDQALKDTVERVDAQKKAAEELGLAWQKAGNYINDAVSLIKRGMNKDFWVMMAPPKKENVLKDYLGNGMGGSKFPKMPLGFNNFFNPFPLTPSQYHPVNTISDLLANKDIKGIQGTYSETAKIMDDLGKELEFVNMKSDALGITMGKHRELFDVARAKVNVYSDTLEKLLKVEDKEKGPSWQADVDKTIANLEKMQAEFDKIQARRDFLNGIRDSFTNLFTSVMSGTESMSNAIKGFANSVLHSFEKLIAEDLANKLMKALFPQQGTGFFDFLMKMLGIGASVATGGLAIPALLAMEGIMGATGGRVPQGYPNDTYPALLTSGETIIPNGLSGLGRQPVYTFEDVKFVIEQDKLVGILKKAGIKNSIY
jgi:TP901 family phage tail tape measure protein